MTLDGVRGRRTSQQGARAEIGHQNLRQVVEARQVEPRFRHQGCQPGNEVEGLEDDVRRAVSVRRPQLVPDVAVRPRPWQRSDESLSRPGSGHRNGAVSIPPCLHLYAPHQTREFLAGELNSPSVRSSGEIHVRE